MTLKEHLQKKPFTLALSSGFFGFFAHYGLTLALREAGLTPRKVTGSSAGSILAAVWSYGIPDHEIKSVLVELKRESFWDPAFGFGLLKGERLEGLVKELISGHQQVLPIEISTFDIFKSMTRSFSSGDVAKQVRASCAVPLMFHPVNIEGRHYWDGGVRDKLALQSVGLAENTLVHRLPSQGWHRHFEGRSSLPLSRKNHVIITAHNLTAVGPYKLENGPLAIEQSYQNAISQLNQLMRF